MPKMKVDTVYTNRAGNKYVVVAVGHDSDKPVTARAVDSDGVVALTTAGRVGGPADPLDLIAEASAAKPKAKAKAKKR